MNDCFKGLFHFAPADHSRTARERNPSEKKLPNDRVAREPFENPFSPELPPQRFAWGRERFSRSRMKRSFY
jgi:hypothetical protein